MRQTFTLLTLLLFLLLARDLPVAAYPLDSYADTGIGRLEGYRLALEGQVKGVPLPPGALLSAKEISLKLINQPDFTLPETDPELQGQLQSILGARASLYGISVLDLTDPEHPRLAEHNPNYRLTPGSVGKIFVALGFFQTLADLYPEDIAARRRVLRETMETADGFINKDTHSVPFWKPGDNQVVKRPLREGDRANLYTFLDWMLSSSSNAAASMSIKNLVLLNRFGADYPAAPESMGAFLEKSPKPELTRWLARSLQEPVERSGMDPAKMRQGSLLTREGKRRIPGVNSYATSHELLRFMVLMEQGKLVDPFSSLEIKKLLYMTDRRIRYASSPALHDAAVFFKSGSHYLCGREENPSCPKYEGTTINIMNSIAIVESINRTPPLYYMVAVTSNILRSNQAVAQQSLATRIHRMLEKIHPGAKVKEIEEPNTANPIEDDTIGQ